MSRKEAKHQVDKKSAQTKVTKEKEIYNDIEQKNIIESKRRSKISEYNIKTNEYEPFENDSKRSSRKEPIQENNIEGKREKKPKKKHKVLKVILSLLLTIIVILSVIFGTYVYKAGGSFTSAVMNIVKDVLGDQDPIFVLVMGVSEDISVELTDTIILIGYNPDTNKAFMLSIPRDTFVGRSEAYAGGYDKINALYQTNPQKTVEAVENLTGVNIDYYVTVKTSALVDIVDAIGGVEYDVPINMDYDDDTQDLHIHLKAGQQVLNGDQAEQLVRFRHNNNGTSYSTDYGDNDIGRMRTQREFLKVVATELISTNNVDKLKEITTIVFNNLTTNVELSKALAYIPYVAQFDVENDLSMDQLPGSPQMLNELWFYKANTSETQKLINSYIEKLGLSDAEKSKYTKPITKNTTTTNNTQKKPTNNNNATQNTTTQSTNTINNNTTTNNVIINSTGNSNNTAIENTLNTTGEGNTTTNPNENSGSTGSGTTTGNETNPNENSGGKSTGGGEGESSGGSTGNSGETTGGGTSGGSSGESSSGTSSAGGGTTPATSEPTTSESE